VFFFLLVVYFVMKHSIDDLQGKFLEILKAALERSLVELRDQIIRTPRYQRGNVIKRWGFTVRKWIQTPVGFLEQVRIPRMRDHAREISLFADRYVKRSGLLTAVMLEMFVWGMSSRRLSVLIRKLYRVGITASTVCQLKRLVMEQVQRMRNSRIGKEIVALVVDGLHGKFRLLGLRGVCLLAIGIDKNGDGHLLDWLGCDSESAANWRRLFRRLRARGLQNVELLVSDDSKGAVGAMRDVWGQEVAHQLCLWHFSRELVAKMQNRSWIRVRRLQREFWRVFDEESLSEALKNGQNFMARWQDEEPVVVDYFRQKWEKLFAYFAFPAPWRHRLRTVNLAEGFFSHLQVFLRRFPGWLDEAHIELLLGLYIQSMKVFKQNKLDFYSREIPVTILNFNRIT
ncbi:MAG: transposase, partial [bacterium]